MPAWLRGWCSTRRERELPFGGEVAADPAEVEGDALAATGGAGRGESDAIWLGPTDASGPTVTLLGALAGGVVAVAGAVAGEYLATMFWICCS